MEKTQDTKKKQQRRHKGAKTRVKPSANVGDGITAVQETKKSFSVRVASKKGKGGRELRKRKTTPTGGPYKRGTIEAQRGGAPWPPQTGGETRGPRMDDDL